MSDGKPEHLLEFNSTWHGSVAVVVSWSVELNTTYSAFYMAGWQGDDSELIQDRLGRISAVAEEFVTMVDQ